MDEEEIRDPDEPSTEDEGGHGLETEPMMPPGEDAQHEQTEGIPLKSIADDVDGDEETEDITDVEAGDD